MYICIYDIYIYMNPSNTPRRCLRPTKFAQQKIAQHCSYIYIYIIYTYIHIIYIYVYIYIYIYKMLGGEFGRGGDVEE